MLKLNKLNKINILVHSEVRIKIHNKIIMDYIRKIEASLYVYLQVALGFRSYSDIIMDEIQNTNSGYLYWEGTNYRFKIKTRK